MARKIFALGSVSANNKKIGVKTRVAQFLLLLQLNSLNVWAQGTKPADNSAVSPKVPRVWLDLGIMDIGNSALKEPQAVVRPLREDGDGSVGFVSDPPFDFAAARNYANKGSKTNPLDFAANFEQNLVHEDETVGAFKNLKPLVADNENGDGGQEMLVFQGYSLPPLKRQIERSGQEQKQDWAEGVRQQVNYRTLNQTERKYVDQLISLCNNALDGKLGITNTLRTGISRTGEGEVSQPYKQEATKVLNSFVDEAVARGFKVAHLRKNGDEMVVEFDMSKKEEKETQKQQKETNDQQKKEQKSALTTKEKESLAKLEGDCKNAADGKLGVGTKKFVASGFGSPAYLEEAQKILERNMIAMRANGNDAEIKWDSKKGHVIVYTIKEDVKKEQPETAQEEQKKSDKKVAQTERYENIKRNIYNYSGPTADLMLEKSYTETAEKIYAQMVELQTYSDYDDLRGFGQRIEKISESYREYKNFIYSLELDEQTEKDYILRMDNAIAKMVGSAGLSGFDYKEGNLDLFLDNLGLSINKAVLGLNGLENQMYNYLLAPTTQGAADLQDLRDDLFSDSQARLGLEFILKSRYGPNGEGLIRAAQTFGITLNPSADVVSAYENFVREISRPQKAQLYNSIGASFTTAYPDIATLLAKERDVYSTDGARSTRMRIDPISQMLLFDAVQKGALKGGVDDVSMRQMLLLAEEMPPGTSGVLFSNMQFWDLLSKIEDREKVFGRAVSLVGDLYASAPIEQKYYGMIEFVDAITTMSLEGSQMSDARKSIVSTANNTVEITAPLYESFKREVPYLVDYFVRMPENLMVHPTDIFGGRYSQTMQVRPYSELINSPIYENFNLDYKKKMQYLQMPHREAMRYSYSKNTIGYKSGYEDILAKMDKRYYEILSKYSPARYPVLTSLGGVLESRPGETSYNLRAKGKSEDGRAYFDGNYFGSDTKTEQFGEKLHYVQFDGQEADNIENWFVQRGLSVDRAELESKLSGINTGTSQYIKASDGNYYQLKNEFNQTVDNQVVGIYTLENFGTHSIREGSETDMSASIKNMRMAGVTIWNMYARYRDDVQRVLVDPKSSTGNADLIAHLNASAEEGSMLINANYHEDENSTQYSGDFDNRHHIDAYIREGDSWYKIDVRGMMDIARQDVAGTMQTSVDQLDHYFVEAYKDWKQNVISNIGFEAYKNEYGITGGEAEEAYGGLMIIQPGAPVVMGGAKSIQDDKAGVLSIESRHGEKLNYNFSTMFYSFNEATLEDRGGMLGTARIIRSDRQRAWNTGSRILRDEGERENFFKFSLLNALDKYKGAIYAGWHSGKSLIGESKEGYILGAEYMQENGHFMVFVDKKGEDIQEAAASAGLASSILDFNVYGMKMRENVGEVGVAATTKEVNVGFDKGTFSLFGRYRENLELFGPNERYTGRFMDEAKRLSDKISGVSINDMMDFERRNDVMLGISDEMSRYTNLAFNYLPGTEGYYDRWLTNVAFRFDGEKNQFGGSAAVSEEGTFVSAFYDYKNKIAVFGGQQVGNAKGSDLYEWLGGLKVKPTDESAFSVYATQIRGDPDAIFGVGGEIKDIIAGTVGAKSNDLFFMNTRIGSRSFSMIANYMNMPSELNALQLGLCGQISDRVMLAAGWGRTQGNALNFEGMQNQNPDLFDMGNDGGILPSERITQNRFMGDIIISMPPNKLFERSFLTGTIQYLNIDGVSDPIIYTGLKFSTSPW